MIPSLSIINLAVPFFSFTISNLSLFLFLSLPGRFKKGVYAISVSGRLPASVIREMRSHNVAYRSRDTSKR